jgi:flagellar protein FlaD
MRSQLRSDGTAQEQCASYTLTEIPNDLEAMVTTFKWVDFLLHRVKRERLIQLMSYYEEIGWIGPKAKGQLLDIARGTLQDVNTFSEPAEEMLEGGYKEPLEYQRVNEYRLTASEHVKSLMFIMKILGEQVEPFVVNRWEADLQEIGS